MMCVSCCKTLHTVEVEYIRIDPPKAMLQRCVFNDDFSMDTNSDLIIVISKLVEAYSLCEAKMDAVVDLFEKKGE